MKIGIIGCRKRDSDIDLNTLRTFIVEFISKYPKREIEFVSGGCTKGGDRFAEILAKELNIHIIIYYPDKSKMNGNSKGEYAKICYARNILIAENSDELIALVAPDRKGGTEHTIKNFIKMKNKNPIIL